MKGILPGDVPLSIGQALLVAVCGMLVVFMMLAALWLVIVVISKVVGVIESRRPAPAAPAKAAPAPAPAAAPAAQADDGELVAVITAAIAAELDADPSALRVSSIKER